MKLFLLIFLISISTADLKKKYHRATGIQNPLEAIEYYREIINDGSKTAYADSSLFRIAMFYYLIGDYEQVINTLDVINSKGDESPLYRKSCYWLMYSYYNRDDTAKALEYAKIIENLKKTNNLKPENPVVTHEKEKKDQSSLYTVQLGAYRDREWAELFLLRLKQHNLESFTIEIGDYIKICSGKFNNKEDAESHLEVLINKGFDGFIVEIEP
jgi:tetratricopeptide (TPR) repeat protein